MDNEADGFPRAGIKFLTATGQMCTDIRQEFILLSDIFGLSALVDTINHPKPEGATEATVLGPFFVEDAKTIQIGEAIASDGKGEHMLVKGRVTDLQGKPVARCLIETWETVSNDKSQELAQVNRLADR